MIYLFVHCPTIFFSVRKLINWVKLPYVLLIVVKSGRVSLMYRNASESLKKTRNTCPLFFRVLSKVKKMCLDLDRDLVLSIGV